MSIAALDLGEMSNSWYLEERLAEIIGQIIVLDSIAPLPTLLTTYRAIKAWKPLLVGSSVTGLIALYDFTCTGATTSVDAVVFDMPVELAAKFSLSLSSSLGRMH
jgi:hypothetical protein